MHIPHIPLAGTRRKFLCRHSIARHDISRHDQLTMSLTMCPRALGLLVGCGPAGVA
eukprot:SAG11_NODE_16428_length_547_cov_2.071429_1_plen_55_part_01